MPQLFEKRRWKIVKPGLLVDDEKPEGSVVRVEIDDSRTTALAAPGAGPSDLSTTAAMLDDGAIWLLIVYKKSRFDNLPTSFLEQLRQGVEDALRDGKVSKRPA